MAHRFVKIEIQFLWWLSNPPRGLGRVGARQPSPSHHGVLTILNSSRKHPETKATFTITIGPFIRGKISRGLHNPRLIFPRIEGTNAKY